MSERYDVAVIGAGIVGVSTALHLQMRGKKVLLLDRREPGRETSYGNAGIIQNYDTLPFGVPSLTRIPGILLNRDTAVRVHYPSLLRHLPWVLEFYWQSRPKGRRKNGRLMRSLNAPALDEHRVLMRGTDVERHLSAAGRIAIYRTKKSFDASAWELVFAKEMGVPFEIAGPGDLAALEPYVKPAFYKAVRWVSSARFTDPGAVTDAYAQRFVREGGAFMQADVRRMVENNGWSLETSAGNINAIEVVVCAGPWATNLLKPLGYHFSLGIKRGYHRHFAPVAGASFKHAFSDMDIGYVMAPMEQGLRLDTGAEFADVDALPNPAQLTDVLPYARQLFPLDEALEAKAWCGNRPCFADSRPVIDVASRHPGLWLNIGHGHSGMTIGPSSARLLSEMMTGEKPFCDPTPYRAGRFSC